MRKEYTDTDGEYGDLVSEFGNLETQFHTYDAVGSTEALVDASGAATDRWQYRAFGLDVHTVGTGDTDFTFIGRSNYQYEPEIDLYLLGARRYDAHPGRFTSEDPSGYDADVNLYRYAANNPVNAIDPSGLQEEPIRFQMPAPTGEYIARQAKLRADKVWESLKKAPSPDEPEDVASYRNYFDAFRIAEKDAYRIILGRERERFTEELKEGTAAYRQFLKEEEQREKAEASAKERARSAQEDQFWQVLALPENLLTAAGMLSKELLKAKLAEQQAQADKARAVITDIQSYREASRLAKERMFFEEPPRRAELGKRALSGFLTTKPDDLFIDWLLSTGKGAAATQSAASEVALTELHGDTKGAAKKALAAAVGSAEESTPISLGRVDNTWATCVSCGSFFHEPRRARHASSPCYLG